MEIICDGDMIWVSGNYGIIIQLNRNGFILKNINFIENVIELLINVQ